MWLEVVLIWERVISSLFVTTWTLSPRESMMTSGSSTWWRSGTMTRFRWWAHGWRIDWTRPSYHINVPALHMLQRWHFAFILIWVISFLVPETLHRVWAPGNGGGEAELPVLLPGVSEDGHGGGHLRPQQRGAGRERVSDARGAGWASQAVKLS